MSHRYAGVVEGAQVEPNHLARKMSVGLLVLVRHQEAPMSSGEAARKAAKVRVDVGQIQHLYVYVCVCFFFSKSQRQLSSTHVSNHHLYCTFPLRVTYCATRVLSRGCIARAVRVCDTRVSLLHAENLGYTVAPSPCEVFGR